MQTVAEGVKGRLAKKRARESVENTQHNSIYSNKLTVRNERGQKVESFPKWEPNANGMESGLPVSAGTLSSRVCVCVAYAN